MLWYVFIMWALGVCGFYYDERVSADYNGKIFFDLHNDSLNDFIKIYFFYKMEWFYYNYILV